MRTRTLVAAGALALLSVGLTAGPASAEGNGSPVNAGNRMIFQVNDGATIRWQRVAVDSPLDTNRRALRVVVPTPTDPAPSPFAATATNRSLSLATPAPDVRNISFDVRTADIGAGAPRFSVDFANGDRAFLTASTCHRPIGTSTFSRADFTGAKTACSFDVIDPSGNNTGTTAGTYAADGMRSAFQVYAAAHPDQVVNRVYLVVDEPGVYVLDRIAFGTNLLYNANPGYAVRCNGSEARC